MWSLALSFGQAGQPVFDQLPSLGVPRLEVLSEFCDRLGNGALANQDSRQRQSAVSRQ